MTTPRRLQVAGVSLALVAATTCSIVWGDSAATSRRVPNALAAAIRTPDINASADDVGGRFTKQPVIAYQPATGEEHFALQLKATLPPATARPRDIAVLIDTTASQAGRPLQNARLVLAELVKTARPDDRLDVWTINTPDTTRSLTRGFQTASAQKVHEAVEYLAKKEYAAGAADLKSGLRKVLRAFDQQAARQQVILYLGDGDSCLNPLNDADRSALAADMASHQVAFFAVPLGTHLEPSNLHGIASATGGAVVRLLGEESAEKFLPKLATAFNTPIFYPTKTTFSAEVAESLPARLPPLRGDAPTLIAGLLKPGAKTITVTAEGSIAGQKQTITVSEAVPPADATNYFLIGLVRQWQSADRTAPALVRADRCLALAYEQTRLARDELLTQAHWALSQNQLDAAGKLFEAAYKFDPTDNEPKSGLKVVARLKDGEITREQLRQQLSDPKLSALRFANGAEARLTPAQLAKLTQEPPPPPENPPVPGTAPAAPPPPAGGDLLEQQRRRQLVQEQQMTQVVDDVISRANREIASDPDVAYDLLKRQLTSIRENTDLSDRVRATLAARLEGALRAAVAKGTEVRQAQQAALQRQIADQARQAAQTESANEQEMIRRRIQAFGTLMNQARFEEAYKEALVLQQEQISKGRPVPVSATAAYGMSLNAANIREYEELRRIKEDRYLLTMLQVDRSHVPFPDEPPVVFPPAATWRELTAFRKDKYDAIGLEGPQARNALKIRDTLNSPISLDKEVPASPLKDVLDFLSDKYNLTFIVDVQAFEQAGAGGGRNVQDTQVNLPKMPGVTLGTAMRFLLAQINGTYIIRRDYVEITTNDRAIAEKAIRAYPVADLVIPIPNGVNQQALNQNLQVLGSSLSANGMAIFGAAGGGGALGFAGPLGALGVLGALGSVGAAGAGAGIGGVGGAVGIGGGGAAGISGIGFGGGNGQTNLGFGGGTLGFGGGQQGQFGNLGGQFGIQGGDTSAILIELIQDVIAPKEWQTRAARYLFANTNTQADDDNQPVLNPDLLNSLGYYQPARALVVRATSRIQTRVGGGNFGALPAGKGALDRPGANALVIRPGEHNRNPGALAAKPAPPKPEAVALAKAPRDPEKVWNDAFDKNQLKPLQVIGVSQALVIGDKYNEVVALLQADLRHGLLTEPCVFDALALALKASGGTTEEQERVLLSGIDLDPKNPRAYLRAADAMNDMGKPDQALAFCKRAAALEPDAADPYAQSLVYLTSAKEVDGDAVQWAAGNLMRREWTNDRELHQAKAQKALNDAIARLRTAGRTTEADKMQSAVEHEKQRDLVIEMMYSNLADLDLTVTEPIGAVCGPRQPQSTGGGLWRGNRLMDPDHNGKFDETYTAAEAFCGSYEVRVNKIWGQPMADKVTIRVTRHQGTPAETQELHRLTLGSDGSAYLKVQLEDGRRKALVTVPPPAPRKLAKSNERTGPNRVYDLLRGMADPAFSGMTRKSIMGGGSNANSPSAMQLLDGPTDVTGSEVVRQNTVTAGDNSHTGAEMMGQAVVAADRSKVTLHVTPVFQTATDRPDVKLTVIPGGQ